MLTLNRKLDIRSSKPIKSNTGKMSVSSGAVQSYNKSTELWIWVSGIEDAGKKEQRFFFISTVVTNYFTDQFEAISCFFRMNFFE